MRSTARRDTPCELALRSALRAIGLRYRVDMRIAGARCRPDVVFPKVHVAVFVDGCFWHGCPQHGTWPRSNAEWWRNKIRINVDRDREVSKRLAANGWRVLRFWEHEDMTAAANTIRAVIDERNG